MNTPPLLLLPLTIARAAAGGWHIASFSGALLAMATFAVAGVLLVIIGCKLLGYCTPGDLDEEIINIPNVVHR